ncbi:hypothetical protein PFISCL1PPCAC_5597 [Pristionchus fissidentatus]|uniref:Uncharacterized protein n=1 Tax=Pristionchus fissidentatus TaxID=1538716 RepID=A0AAV5V3Y4_9BILA|nr:hypothetical protein PFISCL1PPCAC_5597 [Pristionchus fissidentatus]
MRMPLSFAEKRAQTRILQNLSFWLRPESRAFTGANNDELGIVELEKLCGPFPSTQFEADLSTPVLNSALTFAEGLVVEYAATRGYKISAFDFPPEYNLISRLPNGDVEKELSLTLTVLQSIIDGSPTTSTEIAERINQLIKVKESIGSDDTTKLFSYLQERITNSDGVSPEEVDQFIHKIDAEKSYQDHLPTFANHEYLLKGVAHVQFVQRAFLCSTFKISAAFFNSLFSIMTSLVDRLSEEEIESALDESSGHFRNLNKWKEQYVSFETTVFHEKKRSAFTARLFILGPTVACNEFSDFLFTVRSKADQLEQCIGLLNSLPKPVHVMIMESENPSLLKALFPLSGQMMEDNYTTSITGLVSSRVFPLLNLLKFLRKNRLLSHLPKVLSSHAMRRCLKGIDPSTEEWKDTVQLMITSLSAVCEKLPGAMNGNWVKALVMLMKRRTETGDELMMKDWMAQYEHYEKVLETMNWAEEKLETKEKKEESPDSEEYAEMLAIAEEFNSEKENMKGDEVSIDIENMKEVHIIDEKEKSDYRENEVNSTEDEKNDEKEEEKEQTTQEETNDDNEEEDEDEEKTVNGEEEGEESKGEEREEEQEEREEQESLSDEVVIPDDPHGIENEFQDGDEIGVEIDGNGEEEEDDDGDERLAATQSSTQSSLDDGFMKSVSNLNNLEYDN